MMRWLNELRKKRDGPRPTDEFYERFIHEPFSQSSFHLLFHSVTFTKGEKEDPYWSRWTIERKVAVAGIGWV